MVHKFLKSWHSSTTIMSIPSSSQVIVRVLSRRMLAGVLRKHSGREDTVDVHAVETAVGRLRAALGAPNLVTTVVKRGYRLAVEPS